MRDPACFIPFKTAVGDIPLPGRFTYPFYYEPHPLADIAAKDLQDFLSKESRSEAGKSFGVLVVLTSKNELGYLAAASGENSNEYPEFPFVPPVFDASKELFFTDGEEQLRELENKISVQENAGSFVAVKQLVDEETASFDRQLEGLNQRIKIEKAARKVRRIEGKMALSAEEFQLLTEILGKESLQEQYALNDLERSRKKRLAEILPSYEMLLAEIESLKATRNQQSEALQQRLIETYRFTDQYGTSKNLSDIFGSEPPIGAGTCPAPKLLQYAFLNELKPIAFAEFWWGPPPGYDIRKHSHFYPACRGKCEPILRHLLNGIPTDENPVLALLAKKKTIETIFEDEFLVVINKPSELLSIPGGTVEDSVETRMREKYPEATGMLIVHRLDMSTSGLMIVAKTKETHEHLQRQFLKRTVKKRYVALLDGIVKGEAGIMELPLMVDLNDRPRQFVSFEHGKPARTRWKVIERRNGKTLVHFFPETGRTHQLRIHAAHPLGLNAPIVGDELYGEKADRLHLHAEELEFFHPVTSAIMLFKSKLDFPQ